MPLPTAKRAAFTLVELLVALAVGGTVIISARAMLDALGAAATSSQRELAHSAEGAAERALRELVLNLELRGDTATSIATRAGSASFRSWCAAPSGGMESCMVVLQVRADADTGVSVEPSVGGMLLIRTSATPRLLYLASSVYGGRWRTEWLGGQTPPLAVGVATPRDTLVFPVGVWR